MTESMLIDLVNCDSVDGSAEEREAMFSYAKELDYPREPDWHNLEVLSLSRGEDPENTVGHIVRAFSSVMLFLATDGQDDSGPILDDSRSIIVLLDSCYFLGSAYTEAFGKMMLSRLVNCSKGDGLRTYIEFALLILLLRDGAPSEKTELIVELIEEDTEDVLREDEFEPYNKEFSNSFLGFIGYCSGHSIWLDYAKVLNQLYPGRPKLHALTSRMLVDRHTLRAPRPHCFLGFQPQVSDNLNKLDNQ
jgi:hypothetical protein